MAMSPGGNPLPRPGDHQLVITRLVPLPSDPNVISIRVDRRTVAKLRIADVEALGLEAGLPWTEDLASRVERCKAVEKTRRDAYRLLGRRAYSSAELSDRLARHQADASIVRDVIDELCAAGWLDDAAYARQLADEICRNKPAAPKLVFEKLIQRGIEAELARAVADDIAGRGDPADAAERLARRRLPSMAGREPAARVRRIAGLLARRGFDEVTITEVLNRLGLSPDGNIP